MNATTRERWSQFYRTFQEPRSFNRTIDIERTLNDYSCRFEVTIKRWENDEQEPSVVCVSAVEAHDAGGHAVTLRSKLIELDTLAEQYAQTHIDELVELIEKASKE